MRVLIAHAFYRVPGGEDRYVTEQARLLEGGHDVEVLAARNDELPGGLRSAAQMVFSRDTLAAVTGALARFRPDVVHVHNAYPSWGPAIHLAARRTGTPLVMTVHNYRLRCPNGLLYTEGAVCRRCESGVYANAVLHRCFPTVAQAGAYAASLWTHRFALRLQDTTDLFIAPSAFVGGQLTQWGFAAERVRVIRNFTDAPVGDATPGTQGGAYVGRLSAEKGVDVLLRALRAVDDPAFTIVGDGPDAARLRRLAGDLGLTRVVFTGRVSPEEVRSIVSRARFVAFPSRWHENAPLAALEAMALGRPLLVAQMGGLPELVADGAGVVSAAGDAGDLAEKIRLLMHDDALCRRMGKAALSFARAHLSPAQHREQLEKAYEDVRAGGRRPVVTRGGPRR